MKMKIRKIQVILDIKIETVKIISLIIINTISMIKRVLASFLEDVIKFCLSDS